MAGKASQSPFFTFEVAFHSKTKKGMEFLMIFFLNGAAYAVQTAYGPRTPLLHTRRDCQELAVPRAADMMQL